MSGKRRPLASGAARVQVALVAPAIDILGGQAIQATRLLDALRGFSGIEMVFVSINPRLPGVFGLLQRIKYVRTVVTTIAYVWTLLLRLHGCWVGLR